MAAVFAPVLAWTVLIVASLVAIITMSGKERRGADLSKTNVVRSRIDILAGMQDLAH